MIMKKAILFLFVIFGFTAFAQTDSTLSKAEKIKKIYELQDQRDNKEIEKYLSDKDKDVILKAIYSLGNIQRDEIIPSLAKMLNEKDLDIKKAAAFSIGQIYVNNHAGKDLLSELKTAEDISYRCILFEALGKIGEEFYLDNFLDMPVLHPDEDLGKVWGVTRYALRGIKNRNSIQFLLDKLKSKNDEIRLRAAYALWKSSTITSMTPADIPVILENIKYAESAIKLYLINALGPLAVNDTIKQVLLAGISGNSNIQLSIFKVLEKYKLSDSEVNTLFELKTPDEHASLARIRLLYKAGLKDSLEKLFIAAKFKEMLKNKNLSWRERAELFNGLAFLEGNKTLSVLLKETSSKNDRYTAKIIRSISDINTSAAMKALLYKVQVKIPMPSIALIESISKIRKLVIADSADIRQARKTYVKALNSNNVSLMTSVASSLPNLELVDLVPVSELIKAYNKLKFPGDLESMLEFINLFRNYNDEEVVALLEKEIESESLLLAKAAITSLEDVSDKDYIRKNKSGDVPTTTFYDWNYFEKICAEPLIEINTEKGKIKIELLPNDAPFTSISIAKLIDKKYFDGLCFHRVVSNFVIQGGDPEGTGMGGPGYNIRTETSPLKFGTGFVGMASAGRDTEGSQFFITHSPQPHLDGKYTIFGKVVDGMDTVNKIQEGDKIISIKRIK